MAPRPTTVIALLMALLFVSGLALTLSACSEDSHPNQPPGDFDDQGDDGANGDGDPELFSWPTSSAAAQGMDDDLLDEAFAVAADLLYLHSLVVVRHDTLVGERYYHGFGVDTPHDLDTAAQGILAAVVGLALAEAHFDSVEGKALDHFPEYNHDYENDDEDWPKPLISYEHLLTMKAGWGDDTIHREEIQSSENWIDSTFALPLLADPGITFAYSTPGTHILAGCVARASGQTTAAFADSQLFAPLGIDCDLWQQDPQGYHRGGDGMWLTPREMARFGQLFLRGGMLDGVQVLPADWAAASVDLQAGGHWIEGLIFALGYGYGWWSGWLAGHTIDFCRGSGGQYIMLIADLDLIVVTTAYMPDDPELAAAQEQGLAVFIKDYIYPAVLD